MMLQDSKTNIFLSNLIQGYAISGARDIENLSSEIERFCSVTGEGSSSYFRLIKITEVANLSGQSRTTIYRKIANKEFPPPIKLSPGGRSSAWIYGECVLWALNRVIASRNGEEV